MRSCPSRPRQDLLPCPCPSRPPASATMHWPVRADSPPQSVSTLMRIHPKKHCGLVLQAPLGKIAPSGTSVPCIQRCARPRSAQSEHEQPQPDDKTSPIQSSCTYTYINPI